MAIILERNHKRTLLTVSIVLAFIPLVICKYVPFLIVQFAPTTENFLIRISLPIGISFYTFQAVGYLVDIWRGRQKAEQNFLTYALFISFFPQLIAGPIERSCHLLGQLKEERTFNYENVSTGLLTMAIGLFLKAFIADRVAYIVDRAYNNIVTTSGIVLLMATLMFGIQIYCDFNGYSTIARGSAKVLGIDLMENFKRPYFATSCTEFWRRWHISLSTWFRDYLYIPLGGNRCSKGRRSLNIMITFLVSGIWHGANWTFVIWGGLNGLYQVIEQWLKPLKIGGGQAV